MRYLSVSFLMGLLVNAQVYAAYGVIDDPLNMGNIIEGTPGEIWLYYIGLCVCSGLAAIVFYSSAKAGKLTRIIESLVLTALLVAPMGSLLFDEFQHKLDNNAMSYETSLFIAYLGGLGLVALSYFIPRILLGFFTNVETAQEKRQKEIQDTIEKNKVKKTRQSATGVPESVNETI